MEIDRSQWDAFVNAHPEGTVFQSPAMYKLWKATKHMEPVLVALNDSRIQGILLAVIIKEFNGPLGFLSARTVVYGGALVDPGHEEREEVLRKLLQGLIKAVKNRSVFIQFRNFHEPENDRAVFEELGFTYMERLNLLVDTTLPHRVEERMSGSKLRQLRKGQESGAKISRPEDESEVRAYYDILYALYKYKVKKPLPDYSFFHNFWLQSKDNGLGIIRVVKYEGKIIGGILAPVFNNSTIYEWYVCGLDKEYKHCYPSVLATWAAIEYALENNIKTFDFMGVGVPDQPYGVREFKAKFGGQLVNYGRFGRVNNRLLYGVTELGYNVLSALKRI